MVILKLKKRNYRHESTIFLKDVDIEKVLVPEKDFFW